MQICNKSFSYVVQITAKMANACYKTGIIVKNKLCGPSISQNSQSSKPIFFY